ncbi:peptidase [Lacicoccus alkaliphilus]|uniref:4-acetamidobutyryl-CoA deacetylase n=1 Tax=Lacicoccus alkaliphilus DSM 16010 TaxID=1123231 RepID=A0A1M7JU79_9BACL|nr:peptidase [Salinicoccus alkaliphilus]SHM56589.1 4-acetamidobutyryl-CoA deacetylase [Salinicoccus alkaliphilus DSM 16010]
MNIKEKIREDINSKKDEYIQFLQKIIQQPSTSGNELEAQTIVADRLRDLGLDVDVWTPDAEELKKSEFFNPRREDYEGSPNVVGTLKGKQNGKSLILNGHIDVVPAGDESKWINEPYSGTVIDGKLYGRGTTDMKGGNMSTLIALETIINLGIELKGDVIYESVIEEETGGAGTLAAIQRGYKADVALIPEPSEMKIFPKQQGSLWFEVTVEGVSAHGGTRYEGVNAIEKGWVVFQEIMNLEEQRNEPLREHPLYKNNPIPIPINIGQFNGGYFPSAVPEEAIIQGRYGIAPGETIEEAKEQFQSMLDNLKSLDNWFEKHPATVKWGGIHLPPGGCEDDHPMLEILQNNYLEVEKEEAVMAGSTWATDGGLLTQAGGIPSIVFGPGTTSMAHFTDEYVELEKMFKTAEITALSIIEWCEINE